MKKLCFLAILLYSSSLFAQQWAPTTQTPDAAVSSFNFIDSLHGWAEYFGTPDVIYHTADGGHTWNTPSTFAATGFYTLKMNGTIGLAGGVLGNIDYTFDGTNWYPSRSYDSITETVESVAFAPFGTGYALGQYGKVYKSDDLNHWSNVSQAGPGQFSGGYGNKLIFQTASVAYVAGASTGSGAIYKSVDTAKTWTITGTAPKRMNSIFFPTAHTGYAVGSNAEILKSTDAGNSWTMITHGNGGNYYGVWFTDSLTGYVIADTGGVYTYDGGLSWKKIQGIAPYHNTDIQFVDPCHGFISSTYGFAYSLMQTVKKTTVTGATPLTNCDSATLQVDTNSQCHNCTYNWSNNSTAKQITAYQTGTYTVTMTNACGTATASQAVTILTRPTAHITYSRTRNTYTFNGNMSNNTAGFTWAFSGDTSNFTTTSTGPACHFITAGVLYIDLAVTNTCGTTHAYDTINIIPLCDDQLSLYTIYTDSAGTTQPVDITNIGCNWTVNNSNCPWLTVNPSSGSGSGTFHVVIPANTDTAARQCTLTVDSLSILVVQFGKHGSANCGQVDTGVQVNGCHVAAATISNAAYQWFRNGVAINSATSQYYTATQNGYYHVNIIAGNCSYLSNDHYLSVCEGITEPAVNNLLVYPNPSNGTFTITGDMDADVRSNLRIYNMLGQLVYEKNTESTSGHLNMDVSLNTMAEGIYQMIFTSGEKVSGVKLVVSAGLK